MEINKPDSFFRHNKKSIKIGLLGLIMGIIASFVNPFVKIPTIQAGQLSSLINYLSISIIPLFFLSSVNILLGKNIKSVIGTLVTMFFLFLLIFLYKNINSNFYGILIVIIYLISIMSIAITRAVNTGDGYKEIILAAILGYIFGEFLFGFAFIVSFFIAATWFFSIIENPSYFEQAIHLSVITAPLGFVFWFSISLAEQIYLRK